MLGPAWLVTPGFNKVPFCQLEQKKKATWILPPLHNNDLTCPVTCFTPTLEEHQHRLSVSVSTSWSGSCAESVLAHLSAQHKPESSRKGSSVEKMPLSDRPTSKPMGFFFFD